MVTRATLLLVIGLVGCGDDLVRATPGPGEGATRCGMVVASGDLENLNRLEDAARSALHGVYFFDVCPILEGITVAFRTKAELTNPETGVHVLGQSFVSSRHIDILRESGIPIFILTHELVHQMDHDLEVPYRQIDHESWEERGINALLDSLRDAEVRGEL